MVQEDKYFRPPSEAESFLVRVMQGCPHNRCTFCGMFKTVPLRTLPLDEIQRGIAADARDIGPKFLPLVTSLYLEGGDPLALPAPDLASIMACARAHFPALTRVACYATAQSVMRKPTRELAQLGEAGLRRVFMGLESGCDVILRRINKGCGRWDILRASEKLALAGIENDVSLMLGIGGPELSQRHALETADLLNAISPACVRIRTFVPTGGTPMGEDYRQGRFTLMEPHDILCEQRLMVTHITRPVRLLSEHWSNFVRFDQHMPEGRDALLDIIEQALLLPRTAFRPTGLADAIG